MQDPGVYQGLGCEALTEDEVFCGVEDGHGERRGGRGSGKLMVFLLLFQLAER